VDNEIASIFARVECDGWLCVQSLDGAREFVYGADELVVAASVFKVSIALEIENQIADGSIDPRERVTISAAERTPGPVGFSLYQDPVEASLRDLVVSMLTISDNPATDALLRRVGIDTVNATTTRLGLAHTVITSDLRATVDSVGRDAGFADWAAMTASWGHSSAQENERVVERMLTADALTPERTTHTTPRDMATLLRLIWSDQAGPAPACARLRAILGQQLTRHRLASGFQAPVRVSAKSGGLLGVVRNEIGVIQYPDGRAYAAAVFTKAHKPSHREAEINAAIGAAAAAAIERLS
jgi:beta-lactamase class A